MTVPHAEQIEAFHRDGAICLRGLITPEELDVLRAGISLNLRELSKRAKVASRKDDQGWFIEDFCNWQTNSYYKRFIFESSIGRIAAELMRSRVARLFHDHLLVKEPGTQQKTPWHQDQPYYNIEGHQNLSFWIPVDPVSRISTLEFVAGSHEGPWMVPRSFMDKQAKWFPEGSLQEIPDIDSNREHYNILAWELHPGDVVCFHMLTLHAAGPAELDQRRRAFSIRFLGDDVVHAPRAWQTSPEFPGLENEINPGVPMEHALFPVVWETKSDR
jgi:ectoine hydroxylase-related dioxygenase (phytanoyl-CoA dioxygenase family)